MGLFNISINLKEISVQTTYFDKIRTESFIRSNADFELRFKRLLHR